MKGKGEWVDINKRNKKGVKNERINEKIYDIIKTTRKAPKTVVMSLHGGGI